MADDAIIKAKETEAVLGQFKRNLTHILISEQKEKGKPKKGPELTFGKIKLNFKVKPPVAALAHLIGDDNRVDGMRNYILGALVEGQAQEDLFTTLLNDIDIDGLGEILNALGEGYTSFPEKS